MILKFKPFLPSNPIATSPTSIQKIHVTLFESFAVLSAKSTCLDEIILSTLLSYRILESNTFVKVSFNSMILEKPAVGSMNYLKRGVDWIRDRSDGTCLSSSMLCL